MHRLAAGGDRRGPARRPLAPARGPAAGPCSPGDTGPPWDCCSHGNKFDGQPLVGCPEYDYGFWKNVATSGARNVYYLVPQAGGGFREHGTGATVSFHDVTNGRQGLFFFDTEDGRPPHDEDEDGVIDNFSEPITVSGAWQSAGYVFANAERIEFDNLSAATQIDVRAPGEPWVDLDGNPGYDPGESWFTLT